MKDRKKPLLNAQRPEYPSAEDISERRAFLKKLGIAGALGGLGMLLMSCDNVDDDPNGWNRKDDPEDSGNEHATESAEDSETAEDSDTATGESDTVSEKDTETEAASDSGNDTDTETSATIDTQSTDDGVIMGIIE